MFRSNPNMCNRIQKMTNDIDNQLVKNRQDLKPLDISNTTYKSNKELTCELGVCIVLEYSEDG